MLYKLLGILVWKAAKGLLRYRFGRAMVPKSLLAGGLVLVIAGIVLGARQLSNGD
jgi:hypothetical protein